jgi:hypothetical protein
MIRTIELSTKESLSLDFGLGALRMFAQKRGIEFFQVMEAFTKPDSTSTASLQFFSDIALLVVCGAHNAARREKKECALTEDEVLDMISDGILDVGAVMNTFIESLPRPKLSDPQIPGMKSGA